ncbi:MAG: hypothetical protein E6658_12805, partial [Veillonella sp.]|nr:hypothetical protein [Veillonella sp.]
ALTIVSRPFLQSSLYRLKMIKNSPIKGNIKFLNRYQTSDTINFTCRINSLPTNEGNSAYSFWTTDVLIKYV